MKGFKKNLVLLLVVLALMLIGTACSSNNEQPAPVENSEGAKEVEEAWSPTKPITFAVHSTAGSGTDTIARALAASAEKKLGVSIVIENITGGAFVPFVKKIANANPDGYTIALSTESPYLSAAYQGDYPVDIFKETECLMQAVGNFNMLVVGTDAPYNTLEEFIEYAKENPDKKIQLGNSGTGGLHDNTIQQLIKETGLKNIISVAYEGSANAATAVAGGHITGHVSGYPPNSSLIQSGHVKIIALFKEGAERDQRWPDIKSATESGYDVTGLQIWGIAAPDGVPENIKKTLIEAFKAALDEEEFTKVAVDKQNMLVQYTDGETLTKKYRKMYDSVQEFTK